MAGIYLHIPFCTARCTYCDFVSYPERINHSKAYVALMQREIKLRGYELSNTLFNTVYIGGGTPSAIDSQDIVALVKSIRRDFNVSKGAEITIELNPDTITLEKINDYKSVGINRFSIGMQSANDAHLQKLNRRHTANDFLRVISLLKDENISADILVGIENQTDKDVKDSVELASLGGACHISMYALKAEEGTPLFSDYLNGLLPSEDEVASLYQTGLNCLEKKGFERYEVSNFCKDDKKSMHNLNYWRRGKYIGLGLGASSFINDVRFTNTSNFDEYTNCLIANKFPVIVSEEIIGQEAEFEKIMLAFRTIEGLDINEFNDEFNTDFKTVYKKALNKCQKYLSITDNNVKILPEFLFVQNNIIIEFLN